MEEYILKVELETETLFGSGFSVPGVVDQDALCDSYGFPYMKGKTLKGKLREEFEHVQKCLRKGDTDPDKNNADRQLADRLFGQPDDSWGQGLRFSELALPWELRRHLIHAIESDDTDFTAEDVRSATTQIRTYTSIDYETGVAAKGSLRRARMINKGLIFQSTITASESLSKEEEMLLAMAALSLKHLGTMETRGKGYVKCSLWKDNVNITDQVTEYLQEVK